MLSTYAPHADLLRQCTARVKMDFIRYHLEAILTLTSQCRVRRVANFDDCVLIQLGPANSVNLSSTDAAKTCIFAQRARGQRGASRKETYGCESGMLIATRMIVVDVKIVVCNGYMVRVLDSGRISILNDNPLLDHTTACAVFWVAL